MQSKFSGLAKIKEPKDWQNSLGLHRMYPVSYMLLSLHETNTFPA